MNAAMWLPLAASVLVSIAGGGLLGTWLAHKRLSPKSTAEARDITAAAIDKDWSRFQREINRLVKRCEAAEASAEKVLGELHKCEEREIRLKADILRLEAIAIGQGEARQHAAAIVAAERLSTRPS